MGRKGKKRKAPPSPDEANQEDNQTSEYQEVASEENPDYPNDGQADDLQADRAETYPDEHVEQSTEANEEEDQEQPEDEDIDETGNEEVDDEGQTGEVDQTEVPDSEQDATVEEVVEDQAQTEQEPEATTVVDASSKLSYERNNNRNNRFKRNDYRDNRNNNNNNNFNNRHNNNGNFNHNRHNNNAYSHEDTSNNRNDQHDFSEHHRGQYNPKRGKHSFTRIKVDPSRQYQTPESRESWGPNVKGKKFKKEKGKKKRSFGGFQIDGSVKSTRFDSR